MTEYEYYKHLAHGLSEDQADELWRVRDGQWEFLSLVDWQWHDRDEPELHIFPRNPKSLALISADEAAALEADRQRLVRYWMRSVPRVTVYRQRRLPATEEVFGPDKTWSPTNVVTNFLFGRPADAERLTEIDRETAERVIRESRGVAGATAL